jgi:hypothetical protein
MSIRPQPMRPRTKVLGRCCSLEDESLTDVSRPWTTYRRGVLGFHNRHPQKLGFPRVPGGYPGFLRVPGDYWSLSGYPAATQGLSRCPMATRGLSRCPAAIRGLSGCPVATRGISGCPVATLGLSMCSTSTRGLSRCPAATRGLSRCPARQLSWVSSGAQLLYLGKPKFDTQNRTNGLHQNWPASGLYSQQTRTKLSQSNVRPPQRPNPKSLDGGKSDWRKK